MILPRHRECKDPEALEAGERELVRGLQQINQLHQRCGVPLIGLDGSRLTVRGPWDPERDHQRCPEVLATTDGLILCPANASEPHVWMYVSHWSQELYFWNWGERYVVCRWCGGYADLSIAERYGPAHP